jgi:hypothetical protein
MGIQLFCCAYFLSYKTLRIFLAALSGFMYFRMNNLHKEDMNFKKIVAVDETLLNEAALEQLKTIGEEVVVYHDFPTEEEEVIRRIGNADCLLVSFRTPIRRSVLDACPNIRYIGMCCTLYNPESSNVDVIEARKRGITVLGVKDYGDEGIVVEQVIRPTGLLDPVIDVRPSLNQIDDLMEEIQQRIEREERVLVTTLTKRMAEELTEYLLNNGIRCAYIHSDVETLERIKIMDELREGIYDVLVGVNLLREGLDLPEVSLVAILDADKEGFLRSHRSLTQTAGRAARNVNGKVIMYADRITDSMRQTIDETNRRREKQLAYNEAHGITPKQITRSRANALLDIEKQSSQENSSKPKEPRAYTETEAQLHAAADPVVQYMTKGQLQKSIEQTRKLMQEAAKKLDFIEAAQYRDELLKLEELLKEKS